MTGAEFKAARLALGLTQPALAELFETTKRTIVRWETGAVPIPGAAKVAMRLMQTPARSAPLKSADREKAPA